MDVLYVVNLHYYPICQSVSELDAIHLNSLLKEGMEIIWLEWFASADTIKEIESLVLDKTRSTKNYAVIAKVVLNKAWHQSTL